MKVLFVCAANTVRSPMAAEIFLELAGRDSAFAARSVGTKAQGMRELTTRQLAWADAVAVMEARHLAEIRSLWPDQVGKVRVLEVPDDYDPGGGRAPRSADGEGEGVAHRAAIAAGPAP